jgi:hypothetical protein
MKDSECQVADVKMAFRGKIRNYLFTSRIIDNMILNVFIELAELKQ